MEVASSSRQSGVGPTGNCKRTVNSVPLSLLSAELLIERTLMWFDSWPEIFRVLIIAHVSYAVLVVVVAPKSGHP